jgi:hypothetical protein
MKKLILLSIAVILTACQNSKVDYSYPDSPENIRNQRAGKFFGDITLFDGNKKDNQDSKKSASKNQLWLASIEVISGLLPLNTADESSGLIITEWYNQGANSNERIKINLLVKGSEPKPENLALTIFKQVKDKKDVWVDQQSTNQSLSAKLIKDKILEKVKSK